MSKLGSDHFIFVPGEWHGEGKINFSYSPDVLHYTTVWTVSEAENGIIRCEQRVEKLEAGSELLNLFHFKGFSVLLESEALGEVLGTVQMDDTGLGWAFRDQGETGFTGRELYQRQVEGDYLVYAEYGTPELYTVIEGRLWKK